jgi:ubiquinone/menaquinone biosynthesis C-methylase UbiE
MLDLFEAPVRRPGFLARQAGHPDGLLGRLLLGVMARETARFNDEVLDALAIAPGEHVLEIGFGHGRTLLAAAGRVPDARFAGLDIAATAVRAAGRRCRDLVAAGRLDLRAGDGDALPWPDATFDAAFTVHTLYFWPAPERQLSEARRVLRPGGRVVLGFRERTDEAVRRFPAPTYRFHASEEVGAMLARAGLAVSELRSSTAGADLRIAVARQR